MSDTPEQRAMATAKQAERLIEQVTRDLDEGNERLRRMGVDPAKVREVSAKSIPAAKAAEADEQIRKDLEEIDAEVNRAKLSQGGGDGPGKAKRPRSMV